MPASTAEIPAFPAGTPLNVTIVKKPSSEAARKTIVQVLNRDPDRRIALRREKVKRPKLAREKTRGGRPWVKLPNKIVRVHGEVGETGVIDADLPTLTALRSVARFVEVKKA